MARQVIVTTDFRPSLPSVHGEHVQLKPVLLNLIVNGADAMAADDEQQRTLTLRTRATESGVRIDVADHGYGIPEAEIAHVFDMLWTTKSGGIGIGLSICKSIVEAHLGRIMAGQQARSVAELMHIVAQAGLGGKPGFD